ncbi:hypothetical protein MVEN_01096500 [Mycena venus]|uniref:RING-type domain-containing protein n=1 Tax=Mycena venus TaxID=2733690 RepID=A0A8H6Y8G4_9AGAR|nr:hypothetical protein MVEN_01096500 [Mycena venus]
MARLISLLTALVAGVVKVVAEDLLTCGPSNYFPSQYTCFDDTFLCPIVNGDRYLRCGDACYSTSLYSCSNTTLEPISHSSPETLEDCGSSRFFPSQYVCLDGNFLCPFVNGTATLRCDAACYAPSQYTCTNGQLSPVGIPPPTCVPNFGQDEICNSQGCFLLPCCPARAPRKMPHQPEMRLAMPEYTPELEYTLDLGAESVATTPLLDNAPAPSPVRTRSWRPDGVERDQKARSTAYDSAGNLKIAVRGRRAAARDCGICEEVAVAPVRTQCCGSLFCKQHIDEWIYAPTADGRCPSCKAPCVLPPSRPLSPSGQSNPISDNILTDSLRRGRPRTPPTSRSHSQSHSPSPSVLTSRSSTLANGIDVDSAVEDVTVPTKPKYSRPGMDALVRLLSGLVAVLLLLGALSRRGTPGAEVAVETTQSL